MRWVIRSAWALTGLLLIAMLALSVGREPVFDTVLYGVLTATSAAAGGLIARKHPANRVGWILLFIGVWSAVTEVAQGWGYYAADRDATGGAFGEWIVAWSWSLNLAAWVLLLLIFPTGHTPPGRWRLVPWLAALGWCLTFAGQALTTGVDSEFTSGANPLAIDGGALEPAFPLGSLLLLGALGFAVASLVSRFRRAGPLERQQIKWIALAGGAVALWGPIAVTFWYRSVLVQAVTGVVLTALPVCVWLAIMRHRLFEVDVVINRALVYGSLTAMLAATYLSSVLVLQLALSPVTDGSGFAVAVSTLAAAAAFRPARARIQAAVDRRFYRRRYNARNTLEAFAGRLRDEVDLDALDAELRGVAASTMQPAHVSLWLKP